MALLAAFFFALLNTSLTLVLWLGIGISWLVTFISNVIAPFAKRNYVTNERFEFNGFICDQCAGNAAQVKMGYTRGSYNGCGWVAAYNSALLLGLPRRPAEIVRFYEGNGGILLNGVLGVNPLAVKLFFTKLGVKTAIYNLPREMDKRLAASGLGILAYAHKSGAHFVAVKYEGGKYSVYNCASGDLVCREFLSINRWIRESGYTAISLILLME